MNYLDYEGLQRYHELIDARKADNDEVVKVIAQELTDDQKAQARSNIGAGAITGITMNGASKGTSGVIDLGTVLTQHQNISGKADKSATVSNVAWSSNKLTKTINGTTSDVVTAATLKSAMELNNVGNFKAVSTVASQGLTDTEKSNARTNIGAGTVTGIKMNGSSKGSSGVVDLGTVITSLSGYATESWVSGKLNDILGIDASGVEDLVSILSDSDTATGILNTISGKVDKVSGKGLSTNDYTTDEKNKLAGIATGATNVTSSTVSGWGFTKNAGTVTGVKVGSSGSTLSPSSGVITLPAYESGAQVHKAPTTAEVKSALGTGSGTTKFLREDGTWQTPAYITNTDNTGVKLASSISGTKKTDSTVIKAGSSTGLSIVGGTDKFSIGNGTNYIEVPISVSGKQASVAKLGSTTKPVYTSAAGTFAECSTYAGGTAVTLNGSGKGGSTASFYAPTGAGETGQVLVSTGGVPSWTTQSVITHGALGSAIDATKQIDALFA